MSGTALFSFRVGGVHDFLSSARTTEDLWVSSFLIAYLTRAAAVVAVRPEFNSVPIFPHELPKDGECSRFDVECFPNSVLLRVDQERAARLGTEMENAFRLKWREIAGAVGRKLRSQQLLPGVAAKTWSLQRRYRAFETYWGWVPVDQSASHSETFRALSALMESRKTLRNFSPIEAAHIKCTLCGRHQALQEQGHYNYQSTTAFWGRMAGAQQVLRHRFRDSEKLCAICTTCRLAGRLYFNLHCKPEVKIYPSTSGIAAANYRDLLAKADLTPFLKDLSGLMSSLPSRGPVQISGKDLDDDWLYSSTYNLNFVKREFLSGADLSDGQTKTLTERLSAARESLLEARKASQLGEPPGYCALISADGDAVGEMIRAAQTVEDHRKLSRRLGQLPSLVRSCIDEQLFGRLIYGGGDDILGLTPVQNLASGLADLRCKIGTEIPKLGLSAAVLIIPHNDSLSSAVREFERLLRSVAKHELGRGCIVFSVRRQSGKTTIAALPWLSTDDARPLRALQTLIGLMSRGNRALSPRFVSQFASVAPTLSATEECSESFDRLARYYLCRAVSDGARDSALRALQDLLDACCDLAERSKSSLSPPELLANVLILARFLARLEIVPGEEKEAGQ